MIWSRQRIRVQALALLASRNSSDIACHRRALQRWRCSTFGTLDALAWSFAAGALWSAAPPGDKPKSRLRRILLGTANLFWLARRAR